MIDTSVIRAACARFEDERLLTDTNRQARMMLAGLAYGSQHGVPCSRREYDYWHARAAIEDMERLAA